MSTITTNLKLIKPDLTDAADITAMNENWDKIDDKFNEVVPVEKGGTGVSSLGELYAGYAYHLAPNDCSDKDFNTLKTAGYYFGYKNMTNAGYTSEISVLEVIPYSNDWVLQRQTRLTDGVTKQRYYWGGSGWSAWCVIYTSAKHDGIANIAYGSYIGNGTFGRNNKNTITVDFTPRFAIVANGYLFVRWYSISSTGSNSMSTTINLEWGSNSISWYNGGNAPGQLNESGVEYTYIVFG